jgi:hypothetical protein
MTVAGFKTPAMMLKNQFKNPEWQTEAAIEAAKILAQLELQIQFANPEQPEFPVLEDQILIARRRANELARDIVICRMRCKACGDYRIKVADQTRPDGGRTIGETLADDCCTTRARLVIAQSIRYIGEQKKQHQQDKIAFERRREDDANAKGVSFEQRARIMQREYKPNQQMLDELNELSRIAAKLERRIERGEIRDASEIKFETLGVKP